MPDNGNLPFQPASPAEVDERRRSGRGCLLPLEPRLRALCAALTRGREAQTVQPT